MRRAQGAGDPRHRPHVALPGGVRSGRGRGSQPESPSVTCAGSAQMSRMDPRCETAGGAGSSCGREARIPIRGRSAADERRRNGRVAGTPRRAGPSSIGRSSRSGVPAVLRRAASASARRLGPPRGHVCRGHGPVRPCGLSATLGAQAGGVRPQPGPLTRWCVARGGGAARGAGWPGARARGTSPVRAAPDRRPAGPRRRAVPVRG